MPQRVAVVAALGALSIGVSATLFDPLALRLLDRSLVGALIALVAAFFFSGACVVVLFVQIARTLWSVSRLHRSASSVDLFDPDPAHAFAGVTALAGAMVIVLVSYSAATDPTTFQNPTWIGVSVVFVIGAALAFSLPLLGMRRLLKQQKAGLLAASTKRVRRVAAEIDVAVDDGRYQDVPQFKAALDALERDRETTAKTSTWPWDAGTLSRFVPTLLLPLILWLITKVLGRLLDL